MKTKSKFSILVDDPGQPDLYLQSNPAGKNRRYTSDARKATGFDRAQLATAKAQAVLDRVAQKGKGKGKPGEKFPFNTEFKEVEIIEAPQVGETETVVLASGAQKSIRSFTKKDQAFTNPNKKPHTEGLFWGGGSSRKIVQPKGNNNIRTIPSRSQVVLIIKDIG